ncbi:hypothetical protein ACQ9SD_004407 [Escherichia coli]|mgnify:CR=1 FL=1|nr:MULTISPECIES: hypothetical protein [Escherichia]MED0060644.1 hypothetical protein [Escherichia marmotae]EEZ4481171.1 hypothetical protein [Escherichia coli]EFH6904729.1 hypothetical protein [Escherichia coli]EFJ4490980.1 hypothetical protein [Escherichia coli]EFU2692292.1 hypothetical protein [Escherichia coli]
MKKFTPDTLNKTTEKYRDVQSQSPSDRCSSDAVGKSAAESGETDDRETDILALYLSVLMLSAWMPLLLILTLASLRF